VQPRLDVTGAEVTDASETAVLPGFVDTRRHMWQTIARSALPACSLPEYFAAIAEFSPGLTAEDGV